MTWEQYNACYELKKIMKEVTDHSDNYIYLLEYLGEGEFTRKEYNSKLPHPPYRRNPSPALETMRKKGLIKVVRQETYTIEVEGKGNEDFSFELPDGRILTEEQFCEIPFEERLSMTVKVTAVKGKTKIEGVRYYYELIPMDKNELYKKSIACINTLFDVKG